MHIHIKELLQSEDIFDKSSDKIVKLVNKTWLSRYPRCLYMIYDNGSKFKLHFEHLCDSYGIKRKPTTVKNPQANAILERVHQVLGQMLCTSELDMANSIPPMMSMSSLTTQLGPFAVPIIQYLKPHQAQPYSDKTCSSTFCLWPTGRKLEITGNH